MHFTAWSLEWKPDTQPPICNASGQWSVPKLYAYKWATFGVRLVTEPLVIKKRKNWGTLEKLPNRQVRHQYLWASTEIKCSALFKYKILWTKLCFITCILYSVKLSWMFCTPIRAKKTNCLLDTKKNKVAFKNIANIICTHSLYVYIYINIHLAKIHLTFWEKGKKGVEQLAPKDLS